MSKNSAAYQQYITGRSPQSSYLQDGVKFDGVRGNTLLDAKANFDGFIDKKTGLFYDWFKGHVAIVDQASRQIGAANGSTIEWHFQTELGRNAVEQVLKNEGITGITLIHTYMPIVK